MRVTAIILALAISAPAASAGPTPAAAVDRSNVHTASNCPRTTNYYAGKGSMYRGDPLTPKKLTELPPATGYMAVFRTVGGCEIPMTIIGYRTGRRP